MRVLIVLMLLASSVQAQVVRVSNTYERCQNGICRRFSDWGTGTFIADDGTHQWILTAGHCVNKTGPVKVGVRRDAMYSATVVAQMYDETADVAILKTGRHFKGPPVELEPIPTGSTVLAGGHGEFTPLYRTVSLRSDRTLNFAARHGDSGGPVLHNNRQGGVISAIDGHGRPITWFTPLPVFWPWLRMHCPPCRTPRYVPTPQVQPTPEPKDDRVAELERQVAELQAMVEQLTIKRGPQGMPGKDAGPFTLQFISRSKRDPAKVFSLGQVKVTGPGTYQVELPDVTVQWLNGTDFIGEQSFAAGTPVKLDIRHVQPAETGERP